MENPEGSVTLRSGRQIGATTVTNNNQATANTEPDQAGASASTGNANATSNNDQQTTSNPNNQGNKDGLSDGSVRKKNHETVNHSTPQDEEMEEDTFEDASALHEWAGGDQGQDIASMVQNIRDSLSQLELASKKDQEVHPNDMNERSLTVKKHNVMEPIASVSKTTDSKTRCKPPMYDGTTSWSDYLIQFKMIAELNEWSEHEKLLHLGGSLDGVAREVLGDIDESMRNSFDGLVQCLEDRFGPGKKEEIFRALLKNRAQKPGESLPDLAHGMRRLVRNAYPKAAFHMIESMSRNHFIDAIADRSVQRLVYALEPETLDEAVRIAIKLTARDEHLNNQKSTMKKSVSFCRAVQPAQSTEIPSSSVKQESIENSIKLMQEQMERLTKLVSEKIRQPKDIVCFRCNQMGHKANMCPGVGAHRNHQRKSGYQKKLDTVDLEGQSSTQNVDLKGPTVNTETLELKKDGAYISGRVRGVDLSLLVDSGSSATIIKPSVYQKIPITSRPILETTSISMTTASGDKLECEGKGKFTLEINGKEIEYSIWVAEIEGDGILGYDFLSHHDCCLNLRRGELLFGAFPNSPYDDDEFNQVKCCRIATNLDMVLPPESEVLIPAHFVNKPSLLDCGVFEPTFEFDEKYDEVLMAKSIVDTNADNVVIRVLNPSDEVQRIYKNMVIATCEPISESEIFPISYSDETNENVHCNSINIDNNNAKHDTPENEPIPDHLK